MFEPTDRPRILACPPGADFPRALVDGILERSRDLPPEALARVEIFVNTQRMQRRIADLFARTGALLLPRLRLVTALAGDPIVGPASPPLAPAVSPLRRRLELAQLVARLLDKEPDLAPRAAIFDLADSLALLLAEMHDEDVPPTAIAALDVSDRSGHWRRAQKFLQIVNRYFAPDAGPPPDANARQREVVEHLVRGWETSPPDHPVIVAGSTGSRGPTALLMQAVAGLPQGAVVLPGFDFDMPERAWEQLDNALTGEDHAQFRFRTLLVRAGLTPDQVQPWHPGATAPCPARNRLVSLALRPAPVTSEWLREGPRLRGVAEALSDVALIEAPSERAESVAIALALRRALDAGKTAALVTPDRILTRRVRAALDRWRIEPDVSLGDPLDQTAPGRLLRHVAELMGRPLTAAALLVVLKHPLVHSGGARAAHLRRLRALELAWRRNGPVFPTRADLMGWAQEQALTPGNMQADTDPGSDDAAATIAWASWIADALEPLPGIAAQPLDRMLAAHLACVCALAAGPDADGAGALWDGAAGTEARRCIDELQREAPHGATFTPAEYAPFLRAVLARHEVRDPVRPHSGVMIWGTLEARVQGADLVILGGLNEGTWPELPPPDAWLSRDMRHRAGLPVPERRIGLSAHDFQQAIGASEVILSRSLRSDDAQTVASRWLNRLTNLLGGMSDEGRSALAGMRARGASWLDLARALETPVPVPPEPRPAPAPPVSARPVELPVTAIQRLIRDPYAIYARYVLRLRPLDPLLRDADAPLRGTVLHKVLEQFVRNADMTANGDALRARLLEIADRVLADHAPWPAVRLLWRARLERVADTFLQGERARRAMGSPAALERAGAYRFDDVGFRLTAKADRIDRAPDGTWLIYDYKTGTVPNPTEMAHFDKQLLLEAVLAEHGGFAGLDPAPVSVVAHIGLGSKPRFDPIRLVPGDTARVEREFKALIARFQDPKQGFMSRRAVQSLRHGGDYDHLARYGEWDETCAPVTCPVGAEPNRGAP